MFEEQIIEVEQDVQAIIGSEDPCSDIFEVEPQEQEELLSILESISHTCL